MIPIGIIKGIVLKVTGNWHAKDISCLTSPNKLDPKYMKPNIRFVEVQDLNRIL